MVGEGEPGPVHSPGRRHEDNKAHRRAQSETIIDLPRAEQKGPEFETVRLTTGCYLQDER